MQMEVHVKPVVDFKETHRRTLSYARYGDAKYSTNRAAAPSVLTRKIKPYSMVWNRQANRMLQSLYDAGFVTFHIHFWDSGFNRIFQPAWNMTQNRRQAGAAIELGCCFHEFSLFNTNAYSKASTARFSSGLTPPRDIATSNLISE